MSCTPKSRDACYVATFGSKHPMDADTTFLAPSVLLHRLKSAMRFAEFYRRRAKLKKFKFTHGNLPNEPSARPRIVFATPYLRH